MSSIGAFKHDMLNYRPDVTVWTVLSLTQPWASAMFLPFLKRIETRSWRTNYRGRLYIHAAAGYPRHAKEFFDQEIEAKRFPPLPIHRGCILGHVDLVDIKPTFELSHDGLFGPVGLEKDNPIEFLYGDYSRGRFGWITENPVLLPEPIPAKGQLGLWKFTPEDLECPKA